MIYAQRAFLFKQGINFYSKAGATSSLLSHRTTVQNYNKYEYTLSPKNDVFQCHRGSVDTGRCHSTGGVPPVLLPLSLCLMLDPMHPFQPPLAASAAVVVHASAFVLITTAEAACRR